MKTKKTILAGLCSLFALGGFAQQIPEGGKLMFIHDFLALDMLDMSRYNPAYSTTRAASMGGAFGSLGADLASMNINPAGLGMYRSSEFGMSFGLGINQTTQSYSAGSVLNQNGTRARFAPNNIGIALNTYQGSGSLTSFTFGFGYNRLADFNTRSTIHLPRGSVSIAGVFANQLFGIRQADLFTSANPFQNRSISIDNWGGVLAFQTAMVDPVADTDDNTQYHVTAIEPGVTGIDPALRTIRTGSIGEYSIAGGFNIENRWYIGLSIGIQDIYLHQTETYQEWYDNDPAAVTGRYEDYLNTMFYEQDLRYSGTGVNFKFGVIARPTDELRIGLAVHTPTFVAINQQYAAYMYTEFNGPPLSGGSAWEERETPRNVVDYNFRTPTRLIGSVSYTFGQWGVLSVDYERTWYNGIRIENNSTSFEAYKTAVKENMRPTNNVRVGGEFKPVPEFALRAGFGFQQSPIQNDDWMLDAIARQRTINVSGGIGYRFQNMSIDLGYAYVNSKMSSYDLFYYNDGTNVVQQDGYITPKLENHLISLSMGVRF